MLFIFFKIFFDFDWLKSRFNVIFIITMKKNSKKTEKKPNPPKQREPMTPEQKLVLKIALVFVILGAILCAVISGSIFLYKAVCTENSNYILRNVEVRSNGYWQGQNKIISAFLKLNVLKDNIFKLDTKKLQKEALRIPGVKHCEVRRILPDTVQINMLERFPRAKIAGHPSYLVDEHGIIILKKYVKPENQNNLVLLTGVRKNRKFEVNQQEKDFFNAMQIQFLTLSYYSDIEIIAIDISDKDFLKLYVRYAKGKLRQAIMPNELSGADLRLKALRTALIRSHNANDNVKIYNLSFDGRVVCQ